MTKSVSEPTEIIFSLDKENGVNNNMNFSWNDFISQDKKKKNKKHQSAPKENLDEIEKII